MKAKYLNEKLIIPKVHGHDLEILSDGFGSLNAKEYCKCSYCKVLRKRRDSIFNNSNNCSLSPVTIKPKYSKTLLKISGGARQLFNHIIK